MELKVDNWEWLSLIMQGHAAFQFMASAIEMDVFDHLAKKSMTLKELQTALDLQEAPARILMTGLTCLRLTEYGADGKYSNSEASAKYLVKSLPTSVTDIYGWQKYIVYPGIANATECFKKNANLGLEIFPGNESHLYQRIAKDSFLSGVFQKAMSSLSTSTNEELISHLTLEGVEHFVDAGGGDGTNCIAIAKKFPDLKKLTVFDQQAICNIAEKKIEAAGLKSRIGTWHGDLFSTPFPEKMDALLLSHMLTIWSPEQNIQLLKKAHDVLPSKGKVIVFNMGVDDDESGPFSSALGSLYFLCIATGTGRLYTWGEFLEFLKAAGFKNIREQKLAQAHRMWVATKG